MDSPSCHDTELFLLAWQAKCSFPFCQPQPSAELLAQDENTSDYPIWWIYLDEQSNAGRIDFEADERWKYVSSPSWRVCAFREHMNSKSSIEMEPLTDKHDSNEDELRPELVHAFFTHKSHTGPTRSEEAHEATLDPVSFTQTSKRLWMLNHTPFHKLKFIDDRLVGRGHSLFPGPGGWLIHSDLFPPCFCH